MVLSFTDLLEQPPVLKSGVGTLPDGREYTLYELPCSALVEISRIAKDAQAGGTDVSLRDIAAIAAQALLGRPATDDEIDALIEKFAESTLKHIYQDALKFAKLGEEALRDAKKD